MIRKCSPAAESCVALIALLLLTACGENPFGIPGTENPGIPGTENPVDTLEVPDLPFRFDVEPLELPGDSVAIEAFTETGRVLFTSGPSGTPFGRQSYILEPDGGVTFLGEFSAADLNEVGQVIGNIPGPGGFAVLWSDGDLIPIPGIFPTINAVAINNHGEMVGASGTAFRWLEVGRMVYPDHQVAEWPTDINDAGEVLVGTNRYGAEVATIWTLTGIRDIGGGRGLRAAAINEHGAAVYSGRGRGPSPTSGSMVLRDGTSINLGTLFPEPTPSEKWGTGAPLEKTIPLDVNDNNEVVGMATRITGKERGFYWSDGEIVDLNALVPGSWIVTSASHINNAGDIVGWAHSGDADEIPVILRRIAAD